MRCRSICTSETMLPVGRTDTLKALSTQTGQTRRVLCHREQYQLRERCKSHVLDNGKAAHEAAAHLVKAPPHGLVEAIWQVGGPQHQHPRVGRVHALHRGCAEVGCTSINLTRQLEWRHSWCNFSRSGKRHLSCTPKLALCPDAPVPAVHTLRSTVCTAYMTTSDGSHLHLDQELGLNAPRCLALPLAARAAQRINLQAGSAEVVTMPAWEADKAAPLRPCLLKQASISLGGESCRPPDRTIPSSMET